jgi:hypothetical protein
MRHYGRSCIFGMWHRWGVRRIKRNLRFRPFAWLSGSQVTYRKCPVVHVSERVRVHPSNMPRVTVGLPEKRTSAARVVRWVESGKIMMMIASRDQSARHRYRSAGFDKDKHRECTACSQQGAIGTDPPHSSRGRPPRRRRSPACAHYRGLDCRRHQPPQRRATGGWVRSSEQRGPRGRSGNRGRTGGRDRGKCDRGRRLRRRLLHRTPWLHVEIAQEP